VKIPSVCVWTLIVVSQLYSAGVLLPTVCSVKELLFSRHWLMSPISDGYSDVGAGAGLGVGLVIGVGATGD